MVNPVSRDHGVDSQDPIAADAASIARDLVKAKLGGENDFVNIIMGMAAERGIGIRILTAGQPTEELIERGKWHVAFILSLAQIAAFAILGVEGGDGVEAEEQRARGAKFLELIAEKGYTF